MGTTVEKLNHLKETKEQIKDAIIGKGQAVSDDDTFRSYAEKISNIKTAPTLQEKTLNVTSNGTQTVTYDDGYNGLSKVNVNTSVYPTLTRQIAFGDDVLFNGKTFTIPADKKYAIIVMEATWKYNNPGLTNSCTTDKGTIETLNDNEYTYDIHTCYRVSVFRLTKTVGSTATITCKANNKQYGYEYCMACVMY